MGLGSGKKPIPDLGSVSRGQKAPDPGSRDPDPQHWYQSTELNASIGENIGTVYHHSNFARSEVSSRHLKIKIKVFPVFLKNQSQGFTLHFCPELSRYVKKNVEPDYRPCKQGFLPSTHLFQNGIFSTTEMRFYQHKPELFAARILEGDLKVLWRLYADPLLLAAEDQKMLT
jgi:hypothetical protein